MHFRWLRHLPLALLVVTLYLLSYYGWVRRSEGTFKGMGVYSLHYDQVPTRPLRDLLEFIHVPLQSLDESRHARLFDTTSPVLLVEIPEFDDPPNFTIDER
jgi:hypothetical protein